MTAKKSQLESKFENMLYFLGEMHLQLNSLKICKKINVSKMIVYIIHLLVGSPSFKVAWSLIKTAVELESAGVITSVAVGAVVFSGIV